jgi:hypothetical protein
MNKLLLLLLPHTLAFHSANASIPSKIAALEDAHYMPDANQLDDFIFDVVVPAEEECENHTKSCQIKTECLQCLELSEDLLNKRLKLYQAKTYLAGKLHSAEFAERKSIQKITAPAIENYIDTVSKEYWRITMALDDVCRKKVLFQSSQQDAANKEKLIQKNRKSDSCSNFQQ